MKIIALARVVFLALPALLALPASGQVTVPSLDLTAGQLSGPGSEQVLGNFTWEPGASITNALVLTLNGTSTVGDVIVNGYENLTATVDNFGNATLVAPLGIGYGLYDNNSGTAVWDNQAGSSFTVVDAASIIGSSSSQFINETGVTFTKTGANTSVVNWDFTNNGTISVQQGTLEFSGLTFNGTGAANTASGATLQFNSVTLGNGTALTGNANVLLMGATMLGGAAQVSNATLQGELTGSGNLTVLGTLTWMPGANITNTSGLTLNGNVTLGGVNSTGYENITAATVDYAGNATLSSTPGIAYGLEDNNSGTAVWDDKAGSSFIVVDAASIIGSSASQFINEAGATFTKTGANTSAVDWDFTNNGTVSVQQGTLEFDGLTYNGSGSASIAANATLELSGLTLSSNLAVTGNAAGATLQFNSVMLDNGTVVTGNATLLLTGATTLGGTAQVPNATLQGTLTAPPQGNLTGTGSLTVLGTLTWMPGGAIASISPLTLNGTVALGGVNTSGYENITATTVDYTGNATLSSTPGIAYGLYDNNSGTAVWDNKAGSSFTVVDAASIIGSSTSQFINEAGATFIKTGANTSSVDWDFTNNGTVSVQQGTLEFNGLTYNGTGSATIAANATLELNALTLTSNLAVTGNAAAGATLQFNSVTLDNGTVVTGNTPLLLTGATTLGGAAQVSNATLQGTLTAPLQGNVTGTGSLKVLGTLTWAPGGAIANISPLTLNGTVALGGVNTIDYENITVATVDYTGNATLSSTPGIAYGLEDNNSGTVVWDNKSGSSFTVVDAASIIGSSASQFINEAGATFTKTGANTSYEEWDFTNNGTVEVAGGTLNFQGSVTQITGTNLTGGTWQVDAGATLDFPSGTNLTNNYGTIILNGAGASIPALNNLAENDGSFQVLNGGSFTTAGNFTNNGTLVLGGGTFNPPGAGAAFLNQTGASLVDTGNNTNVLSWNFTNNGTISVQAGTLELQGITFNGHGSANTSSGATLQFDSVTLAGNPAVSGNGVTLFTGTDTLSAGVQVQSAALQGYLVGSGSLTVLGNFTWAANEAIETTGGVTLHGPTTIGDVVSNAYEYLEAGAGNLATIYNYGNATVFAIPGQQLGLYDSNTGTAVWDNKAGSSFTLSDSASIISSSTSQFINEAGAGFTKTGANTSLVNWGFTNNGTIAVQGGTLEFSGQTYNGNGSANVTAGAMVQFNSVTLASNPAVSGNGVTLFTGTDTLSAGVQVQSAALQGYLTGSGSLTVSGNFTWAAEEAIENTGGVTLHGPTTIGDVVSNAYEYLETGAGNLATIYNYGNATVLAIPGQQLGLYDSNTGTAVWDNKAGSSFTLADSASIISSSASQFINEAGANFTKTGGNTSLVNWGFTNNGTISVQGGTLEFSGQTYNGNGLANVTAGAMVQFNSVTLASNPAVSGNGVTLFTGTDTLGAAAQAQNAALQGYMAGSGSLTVSGNFTWAAEEAIENTGGVTLHGPTTIGDVVSNAYEYLEAGAGNLATIYNYGNATVLAIPGQQLGLYDSNTGTAVWDNKAGSSFTLADSASIISSSASQFINEAGANFTKTGGNTSLVEWNLNNNGTVEVAGGTLNLQSSVTQISGSDLSGGAWQVDAGATLEFPSGANFTTNHGTVILNGIGSVFTPINALVENDGSFQILNGRSFTTVGNFTNNGTLVVGSGNFTPPSVGADFINEAGATFIKTGGNTSLAQWDFINDGSVSVQNGTLDFSGITYNGASSTSVASGATLQFNSVMLSNGTVVTGAGETLLTGTTTLNGSAQLANSSWQGTVTGGGNLTLTLEGTTTLGAVNSSTYEYLYANSGNLATVDNFGAATLLAPLGTEYGLFDNNTGTALWDNKAGSSFTVNDAASLRGNSASQFINEAGATFIKTGANTSLEQWDFTNNGNISAQGGTLEFSSITFSGNGSANAAAGATIQFNNVTVGNGTVVTGNAILLLTSTTTLNGSAQLTNSSWQGGAVTGNLTLTLEGTTTLGTSPGSYYELLYANSGNVATVDNYGPAAVSATLGTQYGLFDDNSGTVVWDNKPGSSFTVNDAASIQGSSASEFINESGATFTKTGANTSVEGWEFTNNGNISIQGGTLDFRDITFNGVGSANTAAGATLQLEGVTLGNGTVVAGNASVLLTSTTTLAGSAQLPNLVWQGTVTGNGSLTVEGTTTLGTNATSAYEHLYANAGNLAAVDNYGNAALLSTPGTGYGLFDENDGTALWDNKSGSSFTVNDASSILGQPASQFINETGANFTKTGANTSVENWDFTNHGNISVQQGTLDFSGITFSDNGSASAALGATLQFNGVALSANTVVTGNGTTLLTSTDTAAVALQLQNATLTGTLNGVGSLNVLGNFAWNGGSLYNTGGVTLNGTTTIGAGSYYEHLDASPGNLATVDNYGNATLQATPGTGYGLWDDNNGTAEWINEAGSSFTVSDSASILGNQTSQFINDSGATFAKTGANTSVENWAFTNNGTISVQQGTLDFSNITYNGNGPANAAANTTLQFDNVMLGNGTVISGNATLLLTGATTLNGTAQVANLSWQGTVSGNLSLTLEGVTTLGSSSGSYYEYLYASSGNLATVDNYGNATLSGTPGTGYGLYDDNTGTAVWNNEAGSSFTVDDSASIQGYHTSQFINAAGADFIKTGANTSIENWAFTNNGTISVRGGTLDFSNITYVGNGPANAAANATLQFDNVTLGNGTVVTGNATILLTSTTTLNGLAQLANVSWQGTVTGNLSFNLEGVTSLGSSSANHYEYLYANSGNSATVNNFGNATLAGTPGINFGLNDNNSGTVVWNNEAGGSFTVNDATSILGNHTSQFINDSGATFTKTGANTSLEDWAFTNNGAISVEQGTLDFTNITYNGNGSVNAAANATVQFSNVAFGNGTVVTGNATLLLSSTLTLNGSLQLPGVSWQGTVTGNGTLTLNGTTTIGTSSSSYEYLYASSGNQAVVDNYGEVALSAVPGIIYGLYDDGSGTAVWFNRAGSSFTTNDAASIIGNATSQFINEAGADFTKMGANSSFVQWNFTNYGTVEVASGTLDLAGPIAENSGANLTGGSWLVDAGATLEFPSGSNITTNQGTVILNGAGSVFAAINDLAVNDGSFQLLNGRAFTAVASLANDGTASVSGANSTLDIPGNLTVGQAGVGNLTVANGGAAIVGNTLILGSGGSANGTVNLGVNGTIQVGGVNGLQSGAGAYAFNFAGGTLQVAGSDLTTAVNANFTTATTSTIDTGALNATWSGNLGGGGGLVKSGAGSLTLAGNNSYTGATTVNQGALVVNGQVTASAITVAAGALGGNGTVQDVVVNGGIIAPGVANTITAGVVSGFASLTIAGNLVLTGAGNTPLEWHLNTAATNQVNAADLLTILGVTSFNGTPGAPIVFDFQNTGYFDGIASDQTYLLIQASNDLANLGLSLSQLAAINAGPNNSNTAGSYFTFADNGDALEFVVIPEPSATALLLAAAALLPALRRKRPARA